MVLSYSLTLILHCLKDTTKLLKPLPAPPGNYRSDILDQFMTLINIKNEENILLTKVWMVATFIPDISHAIFNVHGGQDAAKTTIQKLIKQLVDPDSPRNLLTVNHDKREFIQQLSHKYVVFYDNLKYKIYWLPEEICKAVTGGGTTVRELYTNEGDIVFNYKNCVGFNGINMIMNEPDVLRRSIILQLESIDENNKIVEDKIFSRAE